MREHCEATEVVRGRIGLTGGNDCFSVLFILSSMWFIKVFFFPPIFTWYRSLASDPFSWDSWFQHYCARWCSREGNIIDPHMSPNSRMVPRVTKLQQKHKTQQVYLGLNWTCWSNDLQKERQKRTLCIHIGTLSWSRPSGTVEWTLVHFGHLSLNWC